MFRIKAVQTPSTGEAIFVTAMIIFIMSFSIIFLETVPHIPIIMSVLFLIIYGFMKKVSYKEMENGITEGAKVGIAATLIFFFIGILISAWMIGGTIPTLVYVGF